MINMDSFGATCPTNWKEICDFLNGRIEAGEDENEVWEAYCNGYMPEAPQAVFSK